MILPLLLVAALALGGASERDAAVERGIRHVEAGEWKEGIAALSEALRRLAGDEARKTEAAEAYLYSGIAYAGLGEASPATSQFAQALLRNPQAQLPETAPPAARDAFAVARQEVEVAKAPPVKKRSPLPYIAGGVAAVGAGVALGMGGTEETAAPSDIPTTFTARSGLGTPQMALLSADPPSASTVRVSGLSINLTFVFVNQQSVPARVFMRTEMLAPPGPCVIGESAPVAVDLGASTTTVPVTSFRVSCPGSFDTSTMNVRLMNAETNAQISAAVFSGGYHFVP